MVAIHFEQPLCLVNSTNLLKRSLQAPKPKQRDLMFFLEQ